MVKQDYDVLVIGSGMGGMSSAALLSQAGYRTLVVEKLPRIGGRCSTIEYKGVKCTTGVIGPEMGGVLEKLFQDVGAEFDVRPAGPPTISLKERFSSCHPKEV
jgi:phytoene dehydrogenase-like protein